MARKISYMRDSARRVLIVTNPSAGSGAHAQRVDELAHHLTDHGLIPERISNLDELAHQTSDPRREGLRAVVSAGGDGTVAAVVNRSTCHTPLAVLPMGTENLLAKYLGLIVSPARLSHTIAHGATVHLDAGLANGHIFTLMVGCGFDAEVVRPLHEARTGHIHHLSYIKPIVDSIRRYRYPPFQVAYTTRSTAEADELSGTFTARWLFVVNVPRYAGGLRIAAEAVAADGLLDVCGFEKGSLIAGLRYLYCIIRGRYRALSDSHCVRATRVLIRSSEEVPYQLDGDPGEMLPLEITVLPSRLRVVVSESWAIDHGFCHT